MSELVEVITDDFTAVVNRFNSLPVVVVASVLTEKEPMSQFVNAVEAFRHQLSSDKLSEFDELGLEKTMPVILAWFEASGMETK
jgi:hypothetical protein